MFVGGKVHHIYFKHLTESLDACVSAAQQVNQEKHKTS